jgi:hypothetical protein
LARMPSILDRSSDWTNGSGDELSDVGVRKDGRELEDVVEPGERPGISIGERGLAAMGERDSDVARR